MAFVITQSVRAKARRELKELKFEYRTLIKEEGNEECVICGKDTSYMLQPENTVLCSNQCKGEYLSNPSLYDPPMELNGES
jgi:hypothetical protein